LEQHTELVQYHRENQETRHKNRQSSTNCRTPETAPPNLTIQFHFHKSQQ
jgi:outer membrane protein W